MQIKKSRYYAAVLLLAILTVAGAIWFQTRAPSGTAYVTSPVIKRDIELSVLATGTLRAASLVSVGAQVSGQIKSLHVKLGDHVKKGQLIAQIDSVAQTNDMKTAETSQRQAEAQLRSSQAELKKSQLAWERQRALYDHDTNAQQDLEAAEAQLSVAQEVMEAQKSQLDAARIRVDTARAALSHTTILAPIEGDVVAVLAAQGQTVNANQTTPDLVMLANLSTFKIKAKISEADVIRVKPGQKAYFTILGDASTRYETTLLGVEPAPDSITAETPRTTSSSNSIGSPIYYNGLMEIPNTDGRLRISMTVQVRLILGEAKQALVIPSTVLLPGSANGEAIVRVIGADGKPVQRKVRTGLDDKTFVQILAGLQENEQIVVSESNAGATGPSVFGGAGAISR